MVSQSRASANCPRPAALWTSGLSQMSTSGPPSCWGGQRSTGPGSRARRSSCVRRVGRCPGGASRSVWTGGRVCSRSTRRWTLVCGNGLGPAPPGSGRAGTRSSPAATSWRSRLRPRRRARLHGPPRAFRAGPHLFAPSRDGVVVPLHRSSGRHLAGAAVAHQQRAHTLDRVGQVEAPADHGLDPHQRPPLVLPAVRSRSLGQLRLQLRKRPLAQPRQRRRPLRAQSSRTTFLPRPPPPTGR